MTKNEFLDKWYFDREIYPENAFKTVDECFRFWMRRYGEFVTATEKLKAEGDLAWQWLNCELQLIEDYIRDMATDFYNLEE